MKHDWYWSDIKFREPQLKQEKTDLPIRLGSGLFKETNNRFPPNLEFAPFNKWDELDNYQTIEYLTIEQIIERYPLTQQEIDKITAFQNLREKKFKT